MRKPIALVESLERRMFLSAAIVHAATTSSPDIAYDTFSYPAGKTLKGDNGGAGFPNAWTSSNVGVSSVAMTDPTNPSFGAGNSLRLVGKTCSAVRNLARPLGTNGTTAFFSFLIRQDSRGYTNNHDYGGLVLGRNAAASAELYVGRGVSGKWAMGVAGNGGTEKSTNVAVAVGKVVRLVVKVDFKPGKDTISLYVNPASGTPVPNLVRRDIDLGSFSQIGMTSGNNSHWSFDDLRVAATMAASLP